MNCDLGGRLKFGVTNPSILPRMLDKIGDIHSGLMGRFALYLRGSHVLKRYRFGNVFEITRRCLEGLVQAPILAPFSSSERLAQGSLSR